MPMSFCRKQHHVDIEMSFLPLKKNTRHIARNYLIEILLIIVVVYFLMLSYFESTYSEIYIIGSSMSPAIKDGEFVLMKGGTPTYGDIVIIQSSEDKAIIKRVIAMEGDCLYLDEGVLYIKYAGTDEFVLVEEDYVLPSNNHSYINRNTYPQKEEDGYKVLDTDGHTVQSGCIFVMGDNRDISNDSRLEYGDIPYEEVVGIVAPWTIGNSSVTAWYTFWEFTFPSWFD